VRFVLAAVVALLTVSASGISALIVPEPCTGYEQPGQEDGACPPTCVRCGCCARAVETMVPQIEDSLDITRAVFQSNTPPLLNTQARDILHVPKLRLA
jgi:hypothetical protein